MENTSVIDSSRASLLAVLREDRRVVAIAAALSLLLPLLHLIVLAELPTFSVPIIDSIEYVDLAHQLLGNTPSDGMPFLHSPFYAGVLALALGCGFDLLGVRVLQSVLNAASCLVLYVIAARTFSRPVARIAAFMWAGYGPVVFFAAEILSVPWLLFLNLASLHLVLIAWKRDSPRRWLLAGAVTGLAATARADILLFAGASSLMQIAKADRSFGSRLSHRCIPFAIALAVPLLVVALANHSRSGRFLPLPTNSGLNFYIGNNSNYQDTIGVRPGSAFDALTHLPLQHGVGGEPNQPEHGRFFYAQSLRFMLANPAGFAACLIYKARALLSSYELPETLDIYTTARHGGVLGWLVWRLGSFSFPFGLLLPLAVLGIWLGREQLRRSPCFTAMLIAFTASLLIYWPSARYRMSLVPLLVILAAAALHTLFCARHALRERLSVGHWITTTLALVAANLPFPHFSQHYNFESEMYYLAGRELIDHGQAERGLRTIETALQIDPSNVAAHNSLGANLARQGKLEEAAQHFRAALRIRPDDNLASRNLERVLADIAAKR